MKRSRNPTWKEAIEAGYVTAEQVREARLTPTAAKLRPETPKAPAKDGTAKLWARLKKMYPEEVEYGYHMRGAMGVPLGMPSSVPLLYTFAIPAQKIAILVDTAGVARELLTMWAQNRGWRCFHYTSAALTTKAGLDLAYVEIGAAYGAQEGAREEKEC